WFSRTKDCKRRDIRQDGNGSRASVLPLRDSRQGHEPGKRPGSGIAHHRPRAYTREPIRGRDHRRIGGGGNPPRIPQKGQDAGKSGSPGVGRERRLITAGGKKESTV